jgi:hypothetical protein
MTTPCTINSINPASAGRCGVLLIALACFGLAPAVQAAGKGPPVFPSPTPTPTATPIPTPTPAPTPLGEDRGNGNSAAENVDALISLTTGLNNTATGWQSLLSNTEGNDNTATGFQALALNDHGRENTATGFQALGSNTTGNSNTAVGWQALYGNTGGFANTATGFQALVSNTTGGHNTAYGYGALSGNSTGNVNTAIGRDALLNNTIGNNNIALGWQAGQNLTTGSSNIDIGNLGLADEANTIRIGSGLQTRTFIAGISGTTTDVSITQPVVIDSAGQLGTISSSRRFKNEIKPMDQTSEAVLALKPVTFHYKSDTKGTPQFGLIAEEVAQINPDLVVRDKNGEIYTVRYEAVNAMLLNEFLKEHRKVEQLEANAANQQKEIKALTASLKEQAAQIQKVSAQLELNKPEPRTVLNKQ